MKIFFILPFSAFFRLIYFSFMISIWPKLNIKRWFFINKVKRNTFDLENYLQHHNDRYFHYLKFKSTIALLAKTINYSGIEAVLQQKLALYKHYNQMQINLDFVQTNSDILQSYHGHYRIIDEERFVSNKQTGGLCWQLTKVFQPHGRGYEINSKDNYFFEGLYREGLRFHGRIFHYDTKFIFYGLFDDGEPYDGIISMPCGRRYEGVVSSMEKPHGNGFLIFENGNCLHGNFNNGRFEDGIYKDFINDDMLQIKKVSIDFRDKFFQNKLKKQQNSTKNDNTCSKSIVTETKKDSWVSV